MSGKEADTETESVFSFEKGEEYDCVEEFPRMFFDDAEYFKVII